MNSNQWPRCCYRFMRNLTNPVRQEASRTENGNIVSMETSEEARLPNLDQAAELNLLGSDTNGVPAQLEDIDDPGLPIPDPVETSPQEPQRQLSQNSAQHAGTSILTH